MGESDPDYYSKEAVLARLRAGKTGTGRNRKLVWILDIVALVAFFVLPFWIWTLVFIAARFARAAPSPIGWANLTIAAFSVFAGVFWPQILLTFNPS